MNRRLSTTTLLLSSLLTLCGPSPAAAVGAASSRPVPVGDVMAGEFALQYGDLPGAARHYLLAARATTDAAVAERAARIALLAGQPGIARLAIERWREVAPDALAMRAAAITLAMRLGEHESAMVDARALLSGTDEEGYSALLAVLSEARGDEAVIARSVLRQVVREQRLPVSMPAWLQLAGLARRLGDRTLSDQVVEAGIERFPDDPRARMLRAARLRENGDLEGARRLLLALRDTPEMPPELTGALAAELARVGEQSMAALLLGVGEQDDASFGQRASWLVSAGDRAGLRALYDEVKASAPAPSSRRRLLLGHIAEALGAWAEAERWYGSVDDGPNRERAMLRRARALARLDRLDEALALARALQGDALADGERARDSFLFEAELHDAAGRGGEALATLERGLAVFERDGALLYARAMLHERAGRDDAALADLRVVLDDAPSDARALNAYGYMLAEGKHEYAAALPFLERAHALEPQSAPILDSLGWVHLRLGRHQRALGLLRDAWAREKDPEIAAHLGEVLWITGHRDEARAVWKAGLVLDPDHPALKHALETHSR